jgi:hypothetical protein
MQKQPKKLIIAVIIIALEALILWGLGVWSLVALFLEDTASFVSALFLLGMVLAAALWASNIAIGVWQHKRWAFSPALILQLITAAIATASFSGEFGIAWLGFGLLIPAAIAFYCVFSKDVRQLLRPTEALE